jgi:hypothetical protein
MFCCLREAYINNKAKNTNIMTIKNIARSYASKNKKSLLVRLIRVFFGLLKRRDLEISLLCVTDTFPEFVPYSAGSYANRARCTVEGIKSIFPVLLDFTTEINSEGGTSHPPILKLGKRSKMEPSPEARQLDDLFRTFGSDKSILHDYHLMYGNLFDDRYAVRNVLEIGIGTNSTGVLSNMGRHGTPGASLRAFSRFFPHSMLIGLDVDRSILFNCERIRTYFVDQLDPSTFDSIEELEGALFDLIIDDGLHLPTANLISMQKLLRKLRPGGWFVVEDIGYAAVDIWRFIISLFPPKYQASLVETQSALVLTINRKF